MLVRFALDSTCLGAGSASRAVVKAQHQALISLWRRYGSLVLNGDEVLASAVAMKARRLDPSLRDLWLNALQNQAIAAGPKTWQGTIRGPNETGIPQLAEVSKVGFVEEPVAKGAFGLCEGDACRSIPALGGFEICIFEVPHSSETFRRAEQLAHRAILPGTPVSDVWASRFHSLVESCGKRITIVDRYAMSRHYASPREQLSGLERFIKSLCGASCRPKYVTLYSAWTKELRDVRPPRVIELMKECLDRYNRGAIGKFSVVMAPNAAFGPESHGRFVRFEKWYWEIDVGLEVLEGDVVARRAQASFKTVLDEEDPYVRETERQLKLQGRELVILGREAKV